MESDRKPRRRVPLRTKLLLAIVAVAALMLGFLLLYFGPATEQSFSAASDEWIERTSAAMRELSRTDNENGQRLLNDLIRHSADARRRALLDIPWSLYSGDATLVSRAIEAQDAARSRRLARNVEVLGKELNRRAELRIAAYVETWNGQQRTVATAFGSRLRTLYLGLSGGVLLVLLLVLALGLDRAIVRPVRVLRQATQKVASGDLAVTIDRAPHDELGDLAADFAEMVRRLRASRDEIEDKSNQLEAWNQTLQDQVQRKTQHLQSALADLRATQLRLTHADKMASLGTLAGGIAHEFNNLIGGIRGCIAEAVASAPDSPAREPLEVALRATERAGTVTAKLLRFARPRVQGMEHARVRELVVEVVDLVEPQARRQGVQVELQVRDELDVRVDTGEMHQVLLNLFTNALQAMPGGGRLTITGRRVGSEVEIAVADTGIGIPEAQISHVFDPFFTNRTEHGTTGEGSGLGLSVSFGIVSAHGGRITVDSEPGRGSTFTVCLPGPDQTGGGR